MPRPTRITTLLCAAMPALALIAAGCGGDPLACPDLPQVYGVNLGLDARGIPAGTWQIELELDGERVVCEPWEAPLPEHSQPTPCGDEGWQRFSGADHVGLAVWPGQNGVHVNVPWRDVASVTVTLFHDGAAEFVETFSPEYSDPVLVRGGTCGTWVVAEHRIEPFWPR